MNIKERKIAEAIDIINNVEHVKTEEVIQTLKDLSYFIQTEDCEVSRELYGHLHRSYDNIVHYGVNVDDWDTIAKHNESGGNDDNENLIFERYADNGGIRVQCISEVEGLGGYDKWTVYYIDSGKILYEDTVVWSDEDIEYGYILSVPSEVNFYVSKYFFRHLSSWTDVKNRITEIDGKIEALKGFGKESAELRAEMQSKRAELSRELNIWRDKYKLWFKADAWERVEKPEDRLKQIPPLPF